MRISANVQNLWTFDKYSGYSVEANYEGNSATNNGVDLVDIPSPAHFLSVLILTFNRRYNMKTFNKLISFAIISMTSLTYTACSDEFLTVTSTDSMQMETYLKNDAELQNILLNGYYHLQDITLNVNYVNSLTTDKGYDYIKNNYLITSVCNESTWDATLGITSEIWEHCFNMINRCNNVLQKLDNASETNRTQYEGEAKFLRAYAYFTLVRLFGAAILSLQIQ